METCKIEGVKQEVFVHRPEKYFRPVGVVRSLILFVDFPDFPGTDSTELVFDEIWTLAEEWFSEASNGRMVNTAEPTPNWIRLPYPMEYYEVRTHWEWVIDAIHAADASVDFTQFDLVHIVVPKNSLANATNSFTTSYAEQSGAGVPAALEGRDRIEREIGEGGMATVYLADDLKHERKVALKVLKPELAAVVGAERFLAEIKTTANLQHPHVLLLHDSGKAFAGSPREAVQ